MPQHAPMNREARDDNDGLWLPLIEYSVRSGVSLSTIRRKIKNNSIPFRLEKGKYLILLSSSDVATLPSEPASSPVNSSPSLSASSNARSDGESIPKRKPVEMTVRSERNDDERWAVPLIERAVKLVSDAFEKTLKEKDERLKLLEQRNSELEDRINELKLLVRVLEEKYEVRY